ncbi:hypothetical protein ACFYVR_09165 [Rhodococcus sp. NPDC003318]|uniref:hypothetical protein n=1 Tax=Rhodococcus sp. NPDC003318 TaxID=3364503 RepID=UPI0036C38A2B
MDVAVEPVSRRRRLWAGVAVIAVLLVAAAGVAAGLRSPVTPPRLVAVVNDDTGAAAIGERVVATLAQSDEFDWEVVDSAAATTPDHLAVVTIPADFSDAVVSLGTTTPRQAELTLTRGSAADDGAMSRLTAAVSEVTSATGIGNLLAGMASARSQLQQAMLPAQVLTGATAAADAQAQRMLAGVDDILPYLETANAGANQLVDVAGQVSGMVQQARGPATELSARLTELDVTIGDVTAGTERLRTGIDALARSVEGFDAGVAASLDRTSEDLTALSTQLTAITGLLGSDVGPGTDLGAALASGFGQLESVSAQLSGAGSQLQTGIGPIAEQAPQLLGSAEDEILGAVTQLKTVSAQLSAQLTAGVDAIPARTAGQQRAMSTTMAAPVAVVDTGGVAASALFDVRNLMVLFAGTTVALGAVSAWMLLRNRTAPNASRASVVGS